MAVLLVRADVNSELGAGHVMRCLALAQGWQEKYGQVVFMMAPGSPPVEERLRAENFKVRVLRSRPSTAADATELGSAAHELEASCVVLDGRHFSSEYEKQLSDQGLRLITIDDRALFPKYYSNIIVNPNPCAESLKYHCPPGTQLLLGTKYALLRREFRNRVANHRLLSQHGRDVLVTMGGADPYNTTSKVLNALAKLPPDDVRVTVVIGPNNPHEEELRDLCPRLPMPVVLHKNVSNMPDLIAGAHLCITAGGGTCWELAFMGVPMLLITIAENHATTVDALAKQGCAVSLGWFHSATTNKIASAVNDLLRDSLRRQQLAENGHRLVDGLGVARIIERL